MYAALKRSKVLVELALRPESQPNDEKYLWVVRCIESLSLLKRRDDEIADLPVLCKQLFASYPEAADRLEEQGRHAEAIQSFQRALSLKPRLHGANLFLGVAQFRLNHFDDAIAEFQQTLKSDPKNAQALFNLGVSMLHGKNDPKRALEYWEKLVETNPDHPQAAFVRDQIKKLKEQPKKP